MGASQRLQGRNLPRRAHDGNVIGYSRRPRSRRDSEDEVEVEVQEDDDENEDDDFVMDDEDVDDYGEVPHSDNHEGIEENLENTLGDFNLDDDD
ncbi:hypothetical protein GUJ93_ZPchr0002g26772 [Zizania palustris]|uniref:Uncharacterized protein n=1 Tax=Zizania palustris TaxID=103762 RepID=A0A8J5VWL2_ZIZPA|nr:hypothetical protein GUJ93_ZPchr0002g26772 [Zizania palustris]